MYVTIDRESADIETVAAIARYVCVGCGTRREVADRYCAECGSTFCPDDPLYQVLIAPMPAVLGHIRHEARKEIAAQVRKLLRSVGVKGISVTAPNYSMAQTIDIRLPEDEHPNPSAPEAHTTRDCPRCQRRQVTSRKLEALILAAYPDLDSRNDTSTDYFDYRLSIW